MREKVAKCEERHLDLIRWHLQRPDETNALAHVRTILNRYMNMFRRFKVGHTHVPAERFARFEFSHQSPSLLVFVLVSEWVHATNAAETRLVEEFINHPQCLNFRLAGDTRYTFFGKSPFFVYLWFGV